MALRIIEIIKGFELIDVFDLTSVIDKYCLFLSKITELDTSCIIQIHLRGY